MTETEIITRGKSPRSKFFLFGLPKFGTNILMGFADFALATLYILAFQVTPFLVGFALAMGKLTIALSQFGFGWISDAKYTRWGRRKPYLIFLSPILGLSFFFLLLPNLIIDLADKTALFLWLLILYQIFNISYGITSPYGSWMAEQFSTDERPRASYYEQIIGFIGSGAMSIFSMIILTGVIEEIQSNPNVMPIEYFLSVTIFGIIPIVLFYLVSFLMPTEPHFKIDSNIFQNLKIIIKNRNYLLVNLMIGIASIAWIMVGSLLLSYIEVVLAFEQMYYYMAAGFFLIGIVGFLYLWRKLTSKLGKKQSVLYIFLVAIIFLPFSLLGLIPMDPSFIFGLIFIIGLTGCLAGWFLLPSIIIADITEDDQKTTGELRAGIYKGFPSIILNLFQTFGLLLMGVILELPDITVGTSTFSWGYVIWGPICSVILIGAYLYSRKFVQLDFEWEKTE
ncbi:MAG: MFS transporter [Candidatus Hodarchaeota archaeon]